MSDNQTWDLGYSKPGVVTNYLFCLSKSWGGKTPEWRSMFVSTSTNIITNTSTSTHSDTNLGPNDSTSADDANPNIQTWMVTSSPRHLFFNWHRTKLRSLTTMSLSGAYLTLKAWIVCSIKRIRSTATKPVLQQTMSWSTQRITPASPMRYYVISTPYLAPTNPHPQNSPPPYHRLYHTHPLTLILMHMNEKYSYY